MRKARAEQAGGRRLRRRHGDDHEPRHSRHDPVGAAADARPGRDRRRRRARLPGRSSPRPTPTTLRRARHRQGRHADVDLRPPDHPGRRVGPVPEVRPRAARRRARLLRRGLLLARGAATEPVRWQRDRSPLAERRPAAHAPREAGPGAGAHQHVPGARPPHRPARPARDRTDAGAARRARPRARTGCRSGTSTAASTPSASPGGEILLRSREILAILRDAYCRTVGVEYMHIQSPEREALDPGARRRRLERDDAGGAAPHPRPAERRRGLRDASCTRATSARSASASRAPSRRSRSSTPCSTRPPHAGVAEVVIGMAHRGRLNVLANIVGKSYGEIFAEFEGNLDPETVQGSGDVKYHKGARGQVASVATAPRSPVSLASNPSHLEAVDPVVEGIVRAKQDQDPATPKAFPVLPLLDPRRRRLRRPGRRRRDAQPLPAAGLPHRRHGPHRHQQPARLHDPADRGTLVRATRPTSPR